MRMLVLAAWLVAGCDDDDAYQVYVERAQAMIGPSPGCELRAVCGHLVYVDCGSSTDGPSYYFDSDTDELVAKCGGFCWMPMEPDECVACPPPGWTCSR